MMGKKAPEIKYVTGGAVIKLDVMGTVDIQRDTDTDEIEINNFMLMSGQMIESLLIPAHLTAVCRSKGGSEHLINSEVYVLERPSAYIVIGIAFKDNLDKVYFSEDYGVVSKSLSSWPFMIIWRLLQIGSLGFGTPLYRMFKYVRHEIMLTKYVRETGKQPIFIQ